MASLCETCAKNKWPQGFDQNMSRARCSRCGELRVCVETTGTLDWHGNEFANGPDVTQWHCTECGMTVRPCNHVKAEWARHRAVADVATLGRFLVEQQPEAGLSMSGREVRHDDLAGAALLAPEALADIGEGEGGT